jgi:hypothetical protein
MKTKQCIAQLAAIVVTSGATASAVTLNLGTTTDGFINDAYFSRTNLQPAGSGVINSFVRLNSNDEVVDGYNASARPVMPDVNTSPTFTRDIQLSEVPLLALNGMLYYEFGLDINQSASSPWLSLDELQIYTRSSPLTQAGTLADLTGSGAVLRYDLDGAGESRILLDYSISGGGSGIADMFAYIPQSNFAGVSGSEFVYLYSMFGATPGYENNAGFQEWFVRDGVGGPSRVPDGGTTLLLLGAALGGLGLVRRKSSKG